MIKFNWLFFVVLILHTSCGGSKIPNFSDELETYEEIVNTKDDISKRLKKKEKEEDITIQILPIQKKYAGILGISPQEAKSIKLYEFIDSWEGTTYRMGGENRSGIDCSFFSQFLYHDVYNSLIERTAEKQFSAPSTDKFIGQEFLEEGDLLFFNLSGSEYERITHVGVYIGHNKFVHSTSRKSPDGNNGVQISNFNDQHWQDLFVAAGRKKK